VSIVKMEPFENVGPNARAVLKSSRVLGNTVEAIHLKLGGSLTKALITLIRVKLNQKTIWEVTGAQLDAMNLYLGMPASTTHLSLYFVEPRARTIQGQLLGAIDTSLGIRDFTIECDLGAGATHSLQAWAEIAPPKLLGDRENALIRGLLLSTLTPNSAADHTLHVNVGNAAGALIKRLNTFHANLTRFRVKRDGVDIFEDVDDPLNDFYQDNTGHDPQAGLYVADFIHDDNQSKAITTRRPDGTEVNHQFIFTTSAGDTLRVIADVYAPLALL
jgi:Viral coat protein P2 N-terminal domain